MSKQSKLLILLAFLFSSILYSQQRTIVFNNEGRIIKNYGYDSYPKIKNRIDFKIENPETKYDYYLLYEWRNQYNHKANVLDNRSLNIKKFNTDTINIEDNSKERVANERFMNFILLRANKEGSKRLLDSIDFGKEKTDIVNTEEEKNIKEGGGRISLGKILKVKNIDLSSHLNEESIDLLFLKWKKLDSITKEKERKKLTTLQSSKQNKEIEKLEKQIEVIELALEKLGLINEAGETPNKIMELQKTLSKLELELVEEKFKKNSTDKEQNTFAKEIEKLQKQLTSTLQKIQQKNTAYFNILHKGVLLTKNNKVENNKIEEIVYDVHKVKLFDSQEEQLRVARVTPDLPQLTTDSELYCHIINLNPKDLEVNPFIISMKAELSTPVDVESPSNIRELQTVDIGVESKILQNDLETAFVESADIPKAIKELDKILESMTKNDTIKPYESAKIPGYYKLLKKPFKDYFIEKFKVPLEKSDITKLKPLVKDLKKSYDFVRDLKNYFPKSNYSTVAYSEYILKYPRPFEAKRKPTIKLLSNQFTVENYTDKVAKGIHEGPTYDIKYGQQTLIEDELPPVHRLYRFSINAGVISTKSISYNYEQVLLANSSIDDLKEIKETSTDFRPSLTFSTYIWKQDLAVNVPLERFYKTAHIDISIDYDDGDILDNIYLGIGLEPLRNIQLAGGFRFGQVDRIDPNNYNPLLPISDQKFSSELDVGLYVSLSLGFDLIPKFYNLIKK